MFHQHLRTLREPSGFFNILNLVNINKANLILIIGLPCDAFEDSNNFWVPVAPLHWDLSGPEILTPF